MLLEKIEQSSDIKKLKVEDYPVLAQEIRQFLLEKISRTGGHLASNLGVVELTMACTWPLIFRRIRSYGTWAIRPIPIRSSAGERTASTICASSAA